MEDIKILELFHRRDEQAISETDNKYGARCRHIAFDMLNDWQDTEECVDDTYLALWRSIPPQYPVCFPAFIYRILRNLSLNRLREQQAQKRGGAELTLALDELADFIPSALTPQKELEAKELAEKINEFLRKISQDDRQIFLARYWLILPTAKIARRFGFSESKVRTSLHRSRKRLHSFLHGEGLI